MANSDESYDRQSVLARRNQSFGTRPSTVNVCRVFTYSSPAAIEPERSTAILERSNHGTISLAPFGRSTMPYTAHTIIQVLNSAIPLWFNEPTTQPHC